MERNKRKNKNEVSLIFRAYQNCKIFQIDEAREEKKKMKKKNIIIIF